MRFNDKEMCMLSREHSEVEGRLNYKCPSSGFRESGYKDRWFKLRGNLLFYFRISEHGSPEEDPAGVLVLENCTVCHELFLDVPYAFSLVFNDDIDYKKHVFSGTTEDKVQHWIHSLKEASYGYWREKLQNLRRQVLFKTGIDPISASPRNTPSTINTNLMPIPMRPSRRKDNSISNKSRFKSHISETIHSTSNGRKSCPPSHNVPVANLLDL